MGTNIQYTTTPFWFFILALLGIPIVIFFQPIRAESHGRNESFLLKIGEHILDSILVKMSTVPLHGY